MIYLRCAWVLARRFWVAVHPKAQLAVTDSRLVCLHRGQRETKAAAGKW